MSHVEPDADSVKLFVGTIPREMTDDELRQMFETYGSVYQSAVVRDRITKESKGCGFIIFYKRQAALDAQAALHGKTLFPNLNGVFNVKPAKSEVENEEEKRLFIGSLPKTMHDSEVRELMEPFGTLEECIVLRERDGNSKGCAFVTFATKKSAQNAIKALNQTRVLEGSKLPLTVRQADTPVQKEMKHQIKNGVIPPYGMPPGSYEAPSHMALKAITAAANGPGGLAPSLQNIGSALNAIASDPVLSSLFNPNMALIQQITGGVAGSPSPSQYQNFGTYDDVQNGGHVANWKNPGLDDTNLFVFNLPEQFREPDLIQLFAPYGAIVSTRVYLDKKTGRSKSFGFVSYDNTNSANAAIQNMNGFHVGNRRLKVELKKPRLEAKPY